VATEIDPREAGVVGAASGAAGTAATEMTIGLERAGQVVGDLVRSLVPEVAREAIPFFIDAGVLLL